MVKSLWKRFLSPKYLIKVKEGPRRRWKNFSKRILSETRENNNNDQPQKTPVSIDKSSGKENFGRERRESESEALHWSKRHLVFKDPHQ